MDVLIKGQGFYKISWMFVVNGIDWHRAISSATEVEFCQMISQAFRFL